MMGVKVEKPLSKNMELVAYHDLNGQLDSRWRFRWWMGGIICM